MSYCTNLACNRPENATGSKFCHSCGGNLLLKDRYRPLKLIGRGGFGRTFLAVDECIPSQPNCVIKQMCFATQDALLLNKATALFRQEAVRLDDLGQHPQIPQLLAYFEQDNRLYLAQELILGKTLGEELLEQGTFNEGQIWELLKDLLPVLQFIHARQVIHRDIKPANIMRRSPSGKLVLIDFGVAKLLTGTALVHTGTMVGSTEYMAPEQTRGKALPASDLYSLGVTCIHLLTGVSPFTLFDVSNDCWAWRDFLSDDKQVSHRLSKILDKLIKNALSQRYKSAVEVMQSLNYVPNQSTKRPRGNNLYSEVGVDYNKLRDLLVAKKWQQADKETWNVMCQALSKPIGSYLYAGDIERLPCEDLFIINDLWVKFSQGHFGLSVQQDIYNSLDGDYGRFCAAVGWIIHNTNFYTSGLNFSLSALRGHLPSRMWAGGSQMWRHAAALAAKLSSCDIC